MKSRRDVSPTPEEGVYYQFQDYAGFFRRLGIDLIDVTAALVIWFLVSIVVLMFVPGEDPPLGLGVLTLVAVVYCYFVVLKCSPIRTLGYKLCGARIVTLQGMRPGVVSLTLRLVFAVFGWNPLWDLIWVSGDDHRQALRDKFAHTYVVKADAQPEGRGHVVYVFYHLMNGAFIFPEVRPPVQNVPSNYSLHPSAGGGLGADFARRLARCG